MDFSQKRLLVVVGPTAVGKTEVAIRLAQHFRTQVISADSRQIFKELTIGTAKPTDEELARVHHHFIDSHSIHDDYDAARFADDAMTLIMRLFEQFDYLLLCGGSGLYIKALLEGFDDIPGIPDEIRERIMEGFEEHGIGWLQQQMQELDPEHLERIDKQNPVRLIRALEVRMATGNSISTFQTRARKVLPFSVVKIGLELDREVLYHRIDARMDAMIDVGLFQEAKALLPFKHVNALQTVGYQEIFGFFEGKYDRDEAIRLLKRNSRRYAKRQLTWFKRDGEIIWMNPVNIDQIIKTASGS